MPELASCFSRILVVKSGHITARGSYTDLARTGLDFAQVVAHKKPAPKPAAEGAGEEGARAASSPQAEGTTKPAVGTDAAASPAATSAAAAGIDEKAPADAAASLDSKEPAAESGEASTPGAAASKAAPPAPSGTLIEAEARAVGGVTRAVYAEYVKANYGYCYYGMVLVFLVLFMVCCGVSTSQGGNPSTYHIVCACCSGDQHCH
jgi:hypothetical protein